MNIMKNLKILVLFLIALSGQAFCGPEAENSALLKKVKVNEFSQLIKNTNPEDLAKVACQLADKFSAEKTALHWAGSGIVGWNLALAIGYLICCANSKSMQPVNPSLIIWPSLLSVLTGVVSYGSLKGLEKFEQSKSNQAEVLKKLIETAKSDKSDLTIAECQELTKIQEMLLKTDLKDVSEIFKQLISRTGHGKATAICCAANVLCFAGGLRFFTQKASSLGARIAAWTFGGLFGLLVSGLKSTGTVIAKKCLKNDPAKEIEKLVDRAAKIKPGKIKN